MIEKLCPNQIAQRLEYIDQQALTEQEITGLVIDVDNTLTPWQAYDIAPERLDWIQQAKQRFAICLLSNTISGNRISRLARELEVPAVGRFFLGRKPFAGGFRDAMRHTGTSPEHTAMIGDQLLADILGGNWRGMYTILVRPLSAHEFFMTRLNRPFEAWCLARLEQRGLLPQVVGSDDHES